MLVCPLMSNFLQSPSRELLGPRWSSGGPLEVIEKNIINHGLEDKSYQKKPNFTNSFWKVFIIIQGGPCWKIQASSAFGTIT